MSLNPWNLSRRHGAHLYASVVPAVIGLMVSLSFSAPPNALSSKSLGGLKYWPGKGVTVERQTIWFELDGLPKQVFRIVAPELVSDDHGAYLPWGHPSPRQWQFEKDRATFAVRIEDVIETKAAVLFADRQIEVRVKVTNLSDRTWLNANAFTCFTFTHADAFDDKRMTRSFVQIGNTWRTLADLFRERSPGGSALTFLGVRGGPDVQNLWVARQIRQVHPLRLATGSACMLSKDGKWVAGITTPTPAYVFNNAGLPCLHADPLLGNIEPGQSASASSFLHVLRGSLKELVVTTERLRSSAQRPSRPMERSRKPTTARYI